MLRLLVLLVALAFALPGAARATQDGWPALHDVVGVAANDVLNVREAPDADAPIVGTLAPDARNVEVIRPNPRQTWGLVNVGGQSGWASLAYLERHPGQWDGSIPERLFCGGTEPFWSLAIAPGGIRFEAPDMASQDYGAGHREPAQGRRDRWSFRAWAQGRGATGVVVRQQCSDGMSDRAYGLTLDLILSRDSGAHTHLAGCCSLSR